MCDARPAMDEGKLARQTADLLDDVAARDLAPGAGSVAAVTAALAAAIAECVARMSTEAAGDADRGAAKALELRERLVLLADANANAYEEARRSLGREAPDDALRDARLGSDLALAAYTPLSRGASHLVRINLGRAPEDDRVGTAQDHAERAAAARARALGQTARD